MAVDAKSVPLEDQEEQERQVQRHDAPAHNPSAPPDEVAINGSRFTLIFSFISIQLFRSASTKPFLVLEHLGFWDSIILLEIYELRILILLQLGFL